MATLSSGTLLICSSPSYSRAKLFQLLLSKCIITVPLDSHSFEGVEQLIAHFLVATLLVELVEHVQVTVLFPECSTLTRIAERDTDVVCD